ncbi:MAG: DUF84 family protein [Patescibacteria group bacterium]
MKKFKIAVGTTSKQKISYLEEILNELKLTYKLLPIQANSGVSDQPISIIETKKGSANRAKDALRKSNTDLAIGIEIGYHKEKNIGYQIFCAVTILDKNNNQITTESHRFLLPKYHQNILNKKLSLGENLEGYTKGTKTKIKQQLHEIIRFRKPFIENALRTALILYLNREDF